MPVEMIARRIRQNSGEHGMLTYSAIHVLNGL
jgi:hypothetical protein